MKKIFLAYVAAWALILAPVAALAQSRGSVLSRVAGRFVALNYNFKPVRVASAGTVAAASPASFQLAGDGSVALADGRSIEPWFVGEIVTIGSGSNSESVTLTAVSSCYRNSTTCAISGNTSNAHGFGDSIASSTAGLQEAIYDAFSQGGGLVSVDSGWSMSGGTNAMINAALPFPSVSIEDTRAGALQYWNVAPAASTFLGAPAALTIATSGPWVGAANGVAGSSSFGANTYTCYTLVDIMGNEGPCSLTSAALLGVTLEAWGFTAPPAATGAVGYNIYMSLSGGSYAAAYKVPLVSQPTVIGAPLVSNGVCVLTKLETTNPSCAITNATYGQTGSQAVVTAYPVVTSQIAPQLGGASTTSLYLPNSNGRTTYAYTPSSSFGLPGVVASSLPFTVIATGAADGVPETIATIQLPPGFMNYVNREIQVCAYATQSGNSTATVENFSLRWDAQGSNTTPGKSVLVGGAIITNTLVTGNATTYTFCQNVKTTVAAATATGGSLQAVIGFLSDSYGVAAGAAPVAGPTISAAAVASLNLALDARLDLVYVHTTGTDSAGLLVQDVTVKVVN